MACPQRIALTNRQKNIRKILAEKALDGLIIASKENVRYLTGFTGDDSWAAMLAGKLYLITDSRYTEQAQQECVGCSIISRQGKMSAALAGLLTKKAAVRRVGVENTMTLAAFASLRKALTARLVPVGGLIEKLREVKTDDEIRYIQRAAAVAFDALETTLAQLTVGMTEAHLAGLLDYQLRQRDATPAFETIVAFGANGSRPHHQPTAQRLKKTDMILIDFGARVAGYVCDITRCFAVGSVSAAYRAAYRQVALAQQAAIRAVGAGIALKDIDHAAREVLQPSGLPLYGHGTGHGIGLAVHEAPTVSGQAEGQLQVGNVITIEPAVYLPGRFGIRLEDNIVVTDSGWRVLTTDKRFDIQPDRVPIGSLRHG